MNALLGASPALPGRWVRISLAVALAIVLIVGFVTVAAVGEIAPQLAWVQLFVLAGVAAIGMRTSAVTMAVTAAMAPAIFMTFEL